VKDKKSEKIDGMLALIMALYRAVMSIGEAPSVYDKGGRGLIVF
jgi:phage terminase large subunit-like protein